MNKRSLCATALALVAASGIPKDQYNAKVLEAEDLGRKYKDEEGKSASLEQKVKDLDGQLLNKEAEIIGVSDHLASEIPLLLELARTGKLDLSHGIIRTVPLEAGAVNGVLDRLEKFGDDARVVISR